MMPSPVPSKADTVPRRVGVPGWEKTARFPKPSVGSGKHDVTILPIDPRFSARLCADLKRTVRGRVEHLENSYSEILTLLKRQVEKEASPATTGTSSQPPRAPSVSEMSHSVSTNLMSPRAPSIFSAIVGTDLLPYDECESLISDYRRMVRVGTPFVIIPESCRAASLVEERPMLAQAIFVVTSWRHPARQSVLRANYLKELGDKYLLRAEKSLDLLQSLIVYFMW